MSDINHVILHNLLKNESYSRKVTPFIKVEYFKDRNERVLFESIQEFILKYNNLPTKEVLQIVLNKKETINEDEYKNIIILLEEVSKVQEDVDSEWLMHETESFCKESAVYNAIMESINIIDGKSKTDSGAIPDILSKALAVSFDTHVGHDYIEDADSRFEFYHIVEKKIPFNLEYFNLITDGGTPAKTLNIVMAGCVHPDTKVMIRYRKRISTENEKI